MHEIWKDIIGYEGLYKVSNMGRIKSCKKNVWNRFKYVNKSEIILKPRYNKKGYTSVALFKNGNRKDFRIHRLVLENFTNNIYDKEQINHINGVKDDNRLENLEWATQSENQKHAHMNGFCDNKIELFIKRFSKPIAMLNNNGKILKVFKSAKQANKYFGVDSSHISAVCNGYRKTSLGYRWKFITTKQYLKLNDICEYDYEIKNNILKPVDMYDLNFNYIRSFKSISEAKKYLNVRSSHICDVCNGKRNIAHNYIWKYHNK